MSAFASLTIDDGEAAPVTHTFTPDGLDAKGVAWWINRNASVPSASELVSMFVRKSPASVEDYQVPGKKVAPRRVDLRLKDPVTYTDTVTSLTLVDYVNEMTQSFLIHPRTSQQNAENLRVLSSNLLLEQNVVDAVDLGQPVWS